MSRGHDAVRRVAWRPASSVPICRNCLSTIQRRQASAAASPIGPAPTESSPSSRAPPPLTASNSHSITYLTKASVLLSRPPLLTRVLTPFEKAFFLYQRRLNERLALPFARYFYYQKGTPGDVEWKRKIKERKTPARDIGVYSGYGENGWNDELLVGDRISEPDEQVERLLRDAEVEVKHRDAQGQKELVKKEEIERPMPRVTKADIEGNLSSLKRRMERTLYLVVKGERNSWAFPNCELEKRESLHTCAERIIVQTGGVNMNTWVVGNMPVGHQVYNYRQAIVNKQKGAETRGEKIFFMKARIMAGQANLKNNKFGLQEFQWLAKEEVERAFHPRDWNAVKNILADR